MLSQLSVAGDTTDRLETAGPDSARLDNAGLDNAGLDNAVRVYARLALGVAFLSAVAARFGLWQGTFDLEHFASFVQYTGTVNSFMPAATIPFLAWAATITEIAFGISLTIGFRVRWVAFGSALLLALFATAMAVSFGLQSPMDHSVYSASACALLLALAESRRVRTEPVARASSRS